MRIPAWICCVTLALLLPGLAPAADAPPDAGLAAEMSGLLQQQGLTGAVWALVDAAEASVRTGAAGVKDASTGERLQPGHRVQVGSVAKTVLALGVLRLVTEGRLALDQPLSTLLPTVAIDNPWRATDPVLLRHLLDHTAGLDDARLSQAMSLRATPDAPLAQTFVRDGPLLRLRTRPGSRSSYSNMGYTLLGRVIEAVTAERYERYLDRMLLQPLAMHDSSFGFVTQRRADAPRGDPRLAMGHAERGLPMPAVPQWLRPAGQFTTTAADMGRLALFMMGDGRIGGQPFIDAALLQAMGRPQTTESARAGLPVGYALGLALRDRHGVVGRCHGGDTVGYHAMFCLFDERQRAFFIAINTDSDSADLAAFDRRLVVALDLASPTPQTRAAAAAPAASAAQVDPRPWLGWYLPAPSRFETLALVDRLGALRLSRDGNGLRLHPPFGRGVPLTPAGGALYRAEGRQGASHVLLVDAQGRHVVGTGTGSLALEPGGRLAAVLASLGAGALGALLLLCRGIGWLLAAPIVRWRRQPGDAPRPRPAALLLALAAVLALALPLPLFARQSFLALGDLTPASALLAGVTALLPVLLVAALWLHRRQPTRDRWALLDALAMLGVLQACGLLAAWGLLPLRLWM
jgi:CubicO group peptidase (beta-lactamase class C family)